MNSYCYINIKANSVRENNDRVKSMSNYGGKPEILLDQ